MRYAVKNEEVVRLFTDVEMNETWLMSKGHCLRKTQNNANLCAKTHTHAHLCACTQILIQACVIMDIKVIVPL